jgi:hypothetical protein
METTSNSKENDGLCPSTGMPLLRPPCLASRVPCLEVGEACLGTAPPGVGAPSNSLAALADSARGVENSAFSKPPYFRTVLNFFHSEPKDAFLRFIHAQARRAPTRHPGWPPGRWVSPLFVEIHGTPWKPRAIPRKMMACAPPPPSGARTPIIHVCQSRAQQAWHQAFQAWKGAKRAWRLPHAMLECPGTSPPPWRKTQTAMELKVGRRSSHPSKNTVT